MKDSSKFIFPDKKDPWTMYALENCPYCNKALTFFSTRNIEIVYGNKSATSDSYVRVYNVSNDKKEIFKEEFKNILNQHDTFPVIFERTTLYGGMDKLIEDFSDPW